MRVDELTPDERRLWRAFAQGRTVDVSATSTAPGASGSSGASGASAASGGRGGVRAEALVALLLGGGSGAGAAGGRPALRLRGAHVTGVLDLRFADIPWPVVLEECRFDRAPRLGGARTRELVLRGSVLPGLEAEAARIDGTLDLSGCRVGGAVALTGAEVRGDVDLRAAVISAPGAQAVAGVRVQVGGDLLCGGLAAAGRMRLSGASVAGEADFEGAVLSNPGGVALDAYHVRIGEDFTFHPGFRAEGRIILSGAEVAAAIGFCGAELSNPGDIALEAVDVVVHRNLDLGAGLAVNGGIRLDGSRIGTVLSFRDTRLSNPGGVALSLERVQAQGVDLRTAAPIEGAADLRGVRTGMLWDAPETWPAELRLENAAYEALAEPLPAARRLAWLGRGAAGYLPQPYEQLAAAYRRLGHEDEARTVLLAKQRHRRTTLPWYGRAWGHLQDATVGYGYRPARAGLWLLVLLALGTTTFALHHPSPADPGKPGPAFHAAVYTLDLLLPVIDFGQQSAFTPHGPPQWLAYALIAAGWLLASTVTAGISRAVTRQ